MHLQEHMFWVPSIVYTCSIGFFLHFFGFTNIVPNIAEMFSIASVLQDI